MVVQIRTAAKAVGVSVCPVPQAIDAPLAWLREWDTCMMSAALSFQSHELYLQDWHTYWLVGGYDRSKLDGLFT